MERKGIIIRSDFNAQQLRGLASHCRDGNQARRLLSLAAVHAADAQSRNKEYPNSGF